MGDNDFNKERTFTDNELKIKYFNGIITVPYKLRGLLHARVSS